MTQSPAQLIPTIVTLSCHNAEANVYYTRGIGRHNVSNLIDVPLTASADPTAIVCCNHVPMNQIYTGSTEAVCPSRKSTVCRSPCTNINNKSISTSAKLPSKAMKTSKHPRKVLKIAHVNICSLRNKVLDNTFDTVAAIQGYNIYRKYRNSNGGGVAVYIQNHIRVKFNT